MTVVSPKRFACSVALLWTMSSASSVHAQIEIGTWVQQKDGKATGLTMTVEACCNGGRRLVYRIANANEAFMTIESRFDGTDAPVMVGGKPSGETMGIKRVDANHTATILKMNGKIFGNSRATLSADGKTLTVENEITDGSGGQLVGKATEVWLRK